MKKVLLLSTFAVFLLAGSVSFASNTAVIESTPVIQDDNTKVKEGETSEKKSEKKSECSSKKSDCNKDGTKSCCKKKEE